ncbi:HutD/Ves family protein [Aequorivita antarctica]|uniref:HutD family protein n=1 Tax=Aequorivita antarctica TaxID=153266 RepID=A0A5C6YXJ2_9FLAO|nr:HutD family protein [Aequorivita antarctica]TXD72127.1 HutD family protein [Aequorivita antarctica]SRX75191.1 Protein Ves [Aequorivita antarctica]
MKIAIRSQQHFSTSQWSGGSTTQLYIFPANATYAARNFEVRISTAKVAVAESTFTALPGVHRKLMILEGAITITHEGHYSKQLKPFEVEEFSGDWKTTAIGTCTDFNVMCTGQQQSDLYHIAMGAGSSFTLQPKEECKNVFLYATSGTIQLQLLDVDYILETGNLMIIEDGSVTSIAISSNNGFGLVVLELD